jgi:hypothetical protein
MTGGSTVGIEEVAIYGCVLCCCLVCMPLRIHDVSACLIQELCLENGGYTIVRNLLAVYQLHGVITREAVIFRQLPIAS